MIDTTIPPTDRSSNGHDPSGGLAAYQRHAQSFFDEYQPKTLVEKHLVESLADSSWHIDLISMLETQLLTPDPLAPRNGSTLDSALALAATYAQHSREIDALSRQSERLHNRFHRALNQLRKLRSAREKLGGADRKTDRAKPHGDESNQ